MNKLVGVLALALMCTAIEAKQPVPMLVSTEWVAAHLDDPRLVLLHVGGQKDYDEGHLAGARLLTLADISVTGKTGLRLELPPVEELERALAKLGVTRKSRIVVYAGNDVLQAATRVWFTLDYLGLSGQASLLNGPLKRWKAEGRVVTTAAPAAAKPGKVRARPQAARLVTAAFIKEHLNDAAYALIDARPADYYSGATTGDLPRPGHIPGAVNQPIRQLLDAEGRLKPADELRAVFNAKPGQPVLAYCQSGQQATLTYFAARMLGLDVRLYDGSFQEWSKLEDYPVESAKK